MKSQTDKLEAREREAAIRRMARVLRLMAHPGRLRILMHLGAAGAAPVHAITAVAGLTQAATSLHLARMREAGVVRAERRGKEVWYDVADRRCLGVLGCVGGGKGGAA